LIQPILNEEEWKNQPFWLGLRTRGLAKERMQKTAFDVVDVSGPSPEKSR
jgi:hypothetical protein